MTDVPGHGEILVECAGGPQWCLVLLWDEPGNSDRRLAIVRRKDTNQVFASKRKLGAWLELSWVDILGALSRDARAQDILIKALSRSVVGE
jgi:hypothetical protein